MDDPYFKLKPGLITPDEDLCDCEQIKEIYLAHKLSSNPLYCMRCNGEIPPERLKPSERLAELIADWNSDFGALYHLWLASGEYENWARGRLLDPKGQVNIDGLKLLKKLEPIAIAYYLWFYDSTGQPPAQCPVCNQNLEPKKGSNFNVCEKCRILI